VSAPGITREGASAPDPRATTREAADLAQRAAAAIRATIERELLNRPTVGTTHTGRIAGVVGARR
jgi:hypothetical protein